MNEVFLLYCEGLCLEVTFTSTIYSFQELKLDLRVNSLSFNKCSTSEPAVIVTSNNLDHPLIVK